MRSEIPRHYLHDEAALRLRDMIRTGELKPGDRVKENEFAQLFGISRTPMREAIKMLAAESLLEIVPNYGPRVRLIEDEELKNMLEVIAVLEATAGEQACKEISGEEMENIRSLHNQMLQALDDGDTDSYFSLNRQIHSAIVAASKNETLQRLYDSLSGRIQVARYSANKTERQWTRSVKEHKEMIVLLDNRNGPGLFKVLREHVRSQQGIILSAYGVERERMKA